MGKPKDNSYRFDLEADALPSDIRFTAEASPVSKSTRIKTQVKGSFVGGPFPWPQFCVAMRLPSRALGVWQLIHHQFRMTRKSEITLPTWMLAQCGMTRWTLYRALTDLERVGLIQTDRGRGHGKAVRISLVELPEEDT
jgi:hypothetical protein